MLEGKDILIIGARSGGYGEGIARAAIRAGARVFGTSLAPDDPREKEFFQGLGAVLIDVPLKYSFDHRDRVRDELRGIADRLREKGVNRLHGMIHTVAGGFPRHPAVMKAVGDILKGKLTFSDLATAVKRDVYYVNAGSFDDTVRGLAELIDDRTHLAALTYRGELPYFISRSKRYLEKLASRLAKQGKRTIVAALPEAWTQSSQFFTGIEIAVMHNYLTELRGAENVSEELRPAFDAMEQSLAGLEGFQTVMEELRMFFRNQWTGINSDSDLGDVHRVVHELLGRLRAEGRFSILRRAVEVVSEFVRDASGEIVVREFIDAGRYEPGDVRQVYYRDLTGLTRIHVAKPREERPRPPARIREWVVFEKEEIRRTLNMYGDNFLFLDRVVMEAGEFHDGAVGFCTFVVPTPDENPIMKDHFVGMPLFGGHLQMEAVAQFGTFMVLKYLKDKKLVPILTGTEFPDLNTMAPPGEKLTIMGTIHVPERRHLAFEAWIENRYARSKGTIRGMVISERIIKKMMASFADADAEE